MTVPTTGGDGPNTLTGHGALQVREFRLLLGAQGVSEIGDRMVPIALAFAVLELGGGAPENGLVLACRTFPLVATLLIRGSRRGVAPAGQRDAGDGAVGGGDRGPGARGILIASVGPGWALAIDAASFAISGAFLIRLRLPAVVAREASSFLADLREGWGRFTSMTWVWTFVAAAAWGNLVWGA